MIFSSSCRDFYYTSASSALTYTLSVDGQPVYWGKAVNPSGIRINIGRRIADWLETHMPDFRGFDGEVVEHPRQMRVFNLYDDSENMLESYTVLLDSDGSWTGGYAPLSQPINGHSDSRQKIFWTMMSETGETAEIIGWAPLSVEVEGDFVFPSEGGTFVLPFTSNAAFTVEETCDWLSVVKEGDTAGTLTVEVQENEDEAERFCQIRMVQPDYVGTDCTQEGATVFFEVGQQKGEPPAQELYDSYLTFDIISGGTINWNYSNGRYDVPIEYSKDGGAVWTEIHPSSATSFDVESGDTVIFRGYNSGGTENSLAARANFGDSTAVFNVRGNVYSLVFGDDFRGKNDFSGRLGALFAGCKIVSAGEMVIPCGKEKLHRMFQKCTMLTVAPIIGNRTGDTSVSQGSYSGSYERMFYGCTSLVRFGRKLKIKKVSGNGCLEMFARCTSLVNAPVELLDTEGAGGAYTAMFDGCTSLVNAPDIIPVEYPSTQMCMNMFRGCTSLVKAPEMVAVSIQHYAFYGMFSGCTSLSYVKCLATEIGTTMDGGNERLATNLWMMGVPRGGTFVKAASMENWTRGASGIPSGWTVVDAV